MAEKDVFEDEYVDPDMDEYLATVAKRFCPWCGKAIEPNPRGRQKVFCSDSCRWNWWKANRSMISASTRIAVCPVCHKTFLAFNDQSRVRKYCSHACANKGRAMEQKEVPHDRND